MPHSLIIGITGSGKTTLARVIAGKCLAQGRDVIVLSPINDIPCTKHFSNPTQFLLYCRTQRNADLFIDESLLMLERNTDFDFLATFGRHYGFRCFFIAQRLKMLTPNIRENCVAFYVFKVSPNDEKELNVLSCGKLAGCSRMKKFHYMELLSAFDEPVVKIVKKPD